MVLSSAARRDSFSCRRSAFADLVADGVDRIERRHRLLEDHGDFLGADARRVRRLSSGIRSRPCQQDLPLDDAAGRHGDQLQDAHGGDGLAAAGLADDADGFAAADRDVDAVDGAHHAVVGAQSASSGRVYRAVARSLICHPLIGEPPRACDRRGRSRKRRSRWRRSAGAARAARRRCRRLRAPHDGMRRPPPASAHRRRGESRARARRVIGSEKQRQPVVAVRPRRNRPRARWSRRAT